MKNTVRYLALLLLLSLSVVAKTKNQKAHIHGEVTLTLAQENGLLEIQLESPAANLIGFEHHARSAKEKQVVKQAEATLNTPTLLFSFVGTHCKPKETRVDISGVMRSEQHQHKHNHAKAHDNDHSEITANYRFRCENTKNLNSVSIELFNQFPKIEKINAMWVITTGQGAELLVPNRNTISLR